jgi:hypothetical protein
LAGKIDQAEILNLISFSWQDFLNMFFRDVYKPIPSDYNLVLALLWRHPKNINLDKVKVVHYCAAVSIHHAHIKHKKLSFRTLSTAMLILIFIFIFATAGVQAMEVHRKRR